jgi:uncharacterized membrane protein YcaP (DUF421 family)
MDHLFFNGWPPIWRIFIVGTCSYITLILLLRAAGKRTLSRMNAYDMVITMALGSILAKVLLTQEISISESIAATFLLILLQYSLSLAMYCFPQLRQIISAKPAVLFYKGRYIDSVMKKERVDKDEIQAAIHEKGISDIMQIEAVILGANGQMSVLLNPEIFSQKHPPIITKSIEEV